MLTAAKALALMTTPNRTELSDAEQQLLAAGRRRDIVHEGKTVATWTWGRGTPVLLVHGWDSRASHLGHFVQALTGAGFAVTAFDAPAHGESAGTQSSVVHHGLSIVAVAKALGPFAGLVVHSVGSPAALLAFANGMRVQASVHIAGPASLERVLRRFADAAQLPPPEFASFREKVATLAGLPIARTELDALAPGMLHPALIVHAPEDPEVPYAESEHLHAAWAGSELMSAPGLGHRRIIRDAGVVSAATRFLSERLQSLQAAA